MDWAGVTFGAFLGIAATFGLLSLVLYPFLKREFLLWVFLRTAAFVVMALTLFPVVLPPWMPSGAVRVDVGEMAVAIGVGCTGPILATYLEDSLWLPRLRMWLKAQIFIGILAALATAMAVFWPWLDILRDLLLLAITGVVTGGLAIAIRAGSRLAHFQAAAWSPIIFIGLTTLTYELSTGSAMPMWVPAALIAIFLDFIISGVGLAERFMVIQSQRDKAMADVREARIAVATDPLTGIANRRGLAIRFRDRKHGRPAGLAVIDCDHFKRINDQFGHDVGDEVLVAVAHGLVEDNVFPARQGGEEFVILLYGEDWQRRAETVRQRITLAVFELVPEMPFPVTASAGLAEVHDDDSLDSAVKRADRALYAAKDAGRDRMLAYSSDRGIGAKFARMA